MRKHNLDTNGFTPLVHIAGLVDVSVFKRAPMYPFTLGVVSAPQASGLTCSDCQRNIGFLMQRSRLARCTTARAPPIAILLKGQSAIVNL